jgi:Ca-activated chloride channel family protein
MKCIRELGLVSLAALLTFGCQTPELRRDVRDARTVVAAQPEAPRLVTVSAAAVSKVVSAGNANELFARVRIHVEHHKRDKRTPVNLALAVDTSGSMEGDAIEQARKACHTMVDALADGDRLAIVTYDSKARVLLSSQPLDAQRRSEAHARIDAITARGTTDMGNGLALALTEVQAHANSENVSRIVLLGDGVPNDASTILPNAQRAAAQAIAITALGLGVDYDETLMGRIAEAGGGKFRFVKEPKEVAALFKEEVLRIQRVAGRATTLRLAAGPGVQIREVVGHQLQGSGRDQWISIGDLVEGEDRDIAVRLTVPVHGSGASVELFDAVVSYQDAVVNGGGVTADGFLSVKVSNDPEIVKAAYDTEVDRSTARASVSSLVLQAIALARAGQLDQAKKLVDQAEQLARERGRALEDATLIAKAADMKKLRDSLPSLVAPPPVAVHHPALPTPQAPEPSMPSPAAAQVVREAHAAAKADLD